MAELDAVLKDFEQRLSSVEAELRKLRGTAPANTAAPQLTHAMPTPPAVPAHYAPEAIERGRATQVTTESVDSSTVLAIIGVVFVILAGAFFIKMSVDSGFLTPIRQVILATVVGSGFFWHLSYSHNMQKPTGQFSLVPEPLSSTSHGSVHLWFTS